MQLSSPRGLESCKSQVPGDLRFDTGSPASTPEALRAPARDVGTRRKPQENKRERTKSAETQGPSYCNLLVWVLTSPGDSRFTTLKSPGTGELQLSSPTGLESCNYPVPGKLKFATINYPADLKVTSPGYQVCGTFSSKTLTLQRFVLGRLTGRCELLAQRTTTELGKRARSHVGSAGT